MMPYPGKNLLLKKTTLSNNLKRLEESYEVDIQWLRDKLKSLHFDFLKGRIRDSRESDNDYFTNETLVETTFYEEAGFYNDQPLMLCNDLYKSSEEWIIRNKGFKLESLSYCYSAICETLVKKRKKYIKDNTHYSTNNIFFTLDDIVLELGVRTLQEGIIPSSRELDNIIKSFLCKPGDQFKAFSRPGDENMLAYCPIIEIKKGTYWLPLPDMLAIAFYLAPLHWMRQDEEYRDIANKNIGGDLEEICGGMLRRTFDTVYTSVNIFKGKNRLTDIDALAIVDDTAVVVQAKNKRMMPKTLSGDIESLKRDFSIVAQQAYDQGEKSSIALINQGAYNFKDANGSRVKIPTINQVFILCVSSGVYYAGAIQVNEYLYQKYTDVKLPIVLSVFDLDLLTRYLANPYELIYYLGLRTSKYRKLISNNEVAPLSSYLFTDYMHKSESDLMLLMDDIICGLDEDYLENQLCQDPKTDKRFSIRYKDAPLFAKLLKSVSLSNKPGKKKVIERLLSLPLSAAIQFSEKMAKYDSAILNPANCGFSVIFDEYGISYFVDMFVAKKDLLARMILNADHYGKNSWVGFLKEQNKQQISFLYVEREDMPQEFH